MLDSQTACAVVPQDSEVATVTPRSTDNSVGGPRDFPGPSGAVPISAGCRGHGLLFVCDGGVELSSPFFDWVVHALLCCVVLVLHQVQKTHSLTGGCRAVR